MHRTTVVLLILLAALLPFAWGWTVHRIISKLWPETPRRATRPSIGPRETPPLDYQI